MGDQRGLPKKSNYFGGLGGLVGQGGQGDGGGHMVSMVTLLAEHYFVQSSVSRLSSGDVL